MTGRLVAVCTGAICTTVLGTRKKKSGILKSAREGPVALGELGLEGDGQADRRYHGGPDKAVYAYASEDYAYWRERLGPLAFGHFGENLVLEGFVDSQVCLGDRLAIGEVEVEVTEPRTPCSTLAWRMEDPKFVKKFARSLRTGFYLSVVRPGTIAAGDAVRLVARGDGPTVEDAFVYLFFRGKRPVEK